jgi:hypothetical protein
MPSELRQVLFPKPELQSAIRKYARTIRHRLPPGEIVECKVEGGTDSFVALRLKDEITGEEDSVSFNEAFVGAALLRFCMDLHIPVPRKGEKALKVVNGDVALLISLKMLVPA